MIVRLALGLVALLGSGLLVRTALRSLLRGAITIFAGAVAFAAALILLVSVLVSFLRSRRRRPRGTTPR
jgi:hypothetical protein